jgi:hypothetical protein
VFFEIHNIPEDNYNIEWIEPMEKQFPHYILNILSHQGYKFQEDNQHMKVVEYHLNKYPQDKEYKKLIQ